MKKKLTVLGVSALLSLSMNAQANYVDLFTTDTYQLVEDNIADVANWVDGQGGAGEDLSPTPVAVEDFTSDPNSIIGPVGGAATDFERDISVNLITDLTNPGAPDGEPQTGNLVKMEIAGGTLDFSNDVGAGGEGVVQWDGGDSSMNLDMTGLGGLDLRALGDGILVEVLSLDLQGGFDVQFGIYTDANNWTQVIIKAAQVGPEFLDFDSLENSDLCGVTVPTAGGGSLTGVCANQGAPGVGNPFTASNVGAIDLIINIDGGQVAVDLSIGPAIIPPVPEPSIIGLLGMGLMAGGFAGYRNRKKRS